MPIASSVDRLELRHRLLERNRRGRRSAAASSRTTWPTKRTCARRIRPRSTVARPTRSSAPRWRDGAATDGAAIRSRTSLSSRACASAMWRTSTVPAMQPSSASRCRRTKPAAVSSSSSRLPSSTQCLPARRSDRTSAAIAGTWASRQRPCRYRTLAPLSSSGAIHIVKAAMYRGDRRPPPGGFTESGRWLRYGPFRRVLRRFHFQGQPSCRHSSVASFMSRSCRSRSYLPAPRRLRAGAPPWTSAAPTWWPAPTVGRSLPPGPAVRARPWPPSCRRAGATPTRSPHCGSPSDATERVASAICGSSRAPAASSVYGAYAKAAFDPAGNLVHLIDRLARVPAAGLVPARVDAQQALRTAMARLHPGVAGVAAADRDLGHHHRVRGRCLLPRGADRDGGRGAARRRLADARLAGRDLEREEKPAASHAGERRRPDPRRRAAHGQRLLQRVPGRSPDSRSRPSSPGRARATRSRRSDGSPARREDINISGNNVDAYLDTDDDNRPDAGGAVVTNGKFLTPPTSRRSRRRPRTPRVAVQNLFYLNNVLHDTLYQHGFNEAAGNFQETTSATAAGERLGERPKRRTATGWTTPTSRRRPTAASRACRCSSGRGPDPTFEVVVNSPINVDATVRNRPGRRRRASPVTGLVNDGAGPRRRRLHGAPGRP